MLPRPTLPRPTLSRPLPRPTTKSSAPQVPAAPPVVSKPAQPSAFVTQLIEYAGTPEQTILPHGLSPETDWNDNELPDFLMDEDYVPAPVEPDPPPEAPWDEPFATGTAPSELAMREYEHQQRSHGRPAHQPPTDLPYGQRPPRPTFK